MKVDFFVVGPQKAATTWVYECLKEHDEIVVPINGHLVHYYDIFYQKGEEWYKSFFPEINQDQKFLDPTPTYIRSPWAPKRIAQDNPQAKIIISLRNPIDRAFSHYWHEKKKQKIAFEFEEVLENYDLYSSWIEPGLYAEHIERYLRYFDKEQFLFLRFEDLKRDSEKFLHQILTFIGVNTDFEPSFLNKKANPAKGKHTPIYKMWTKLKSIPVGTKFESNLRSLGIDNVVKKLENMPMIGKALNNKDEYERGIPKKFRLELLELIEPEIQRLENLLEMDLSNWREV
ncbi:MAG: sulfotransferase domain-containing protein [Bacteroidota bacterium]